MQLITKSNNIMDIKTAREINDIRVAAKISSEVLEIVLKKIHPGMSTAQLDENAHNEIISRKSKPAFLGYRGYPASICVSINNELVHGIPSESKMLKEGDLVSVDLGVNHKGFYGDIAETVPVGKISMSAQKLMDVTYRSFQQAYKNACCGKRIGDISFSIQSYVEQNGFSVVRDYCGHGIGRELHEKPEVPDFGRAGSGQELIQGMVIAIEPMVCEGDWRLRILSDGWTAVTLDNKLCAHYERMVLITENGPEILN